MSNTKTADNSRTSWQARLVSLAPYLVCLLIFLILPGFLSSYYMSMLTKVLIFAIFAISLDLILGYTGLLSLGHAAYLGMAGYTAGILMVRFGLHSFWMVVPLGIIAAGIAAAIIGYMSLRVSGVYFLLVTLAFGQMLSVIAIKWRSMTGGTDGLVSIPFPDLGIAGFHFSAFSFYYLVFIAFIICFILLRLIIYSPFGRALVGIRENEPRMQCLGYNTWAHKYVAFILSGIFCGVAGVLYASFYGAMLPEHLGLTTSATVMLMVIIGGAGTLFGPVLGSIVVILLQAFANVYAPERWPLILGGVFILCVLFIRGGFAIYLSKFWSKMRVRYGSIKSREPD